MPFNVAFLRCPPAGSRRDAARREAKDPAPPPGAAGTKAAHAPGNPANHTGAGKNDPRNPGHGSYKRQEVTREGRPGSSLTRDLPGAGGVGESRLGRRDPRDAQAVTAKRRTPARGKHYRNRAWAKARNRSRNRNHMQYAQVRHRGGSREGGKEVGEGREEEDCERGGKRRSSKRRRR